MSKPTDPLDDVDLATLEQVQQLFARVDPVPAELADRTRFAITVHALQAELAELIQDQGVLTRSSSDATRAESITFTSGTISLMVTATLSPDESLARMDGWVTRGGAVVDVVTSDKTQSVTTDVNGRFVVEALPRGWVHFVIWVEPDRKDTRPVITPRIQL